MRPEDDDPQPAAGEGVEDPRPATSEAEAWAAIVAHYGERPMLDDDEPSSDAPTVDDTSAQPPAESREERLRRLDGLFAGLQPPPARHEPEPDEHFTPPEPPPVELPVGARLLAWGGLFAAPLLLVVLAVAPTVIGWYAPSWLLLLLVAWFVGGFGFLVATMSREPRDDWDDGAQI